jgi:hypothetical protein
MRGVGEAGQAKLTLNPKTAFEKARLAESCGHQRVALFARPTSSAPSEKRNLLLLRIFLAIHAIQKRFSD